MTSKQRAYLKRSGNENGCHYPAWQGRSYTGKTPRLVDEALASERAD